MKALLFMGVLFALVVGIVSFSHWRFNARINRETKELFSNNTVMKEVITEEMTRDLPSPVKRWIENSGIIDNEKIHTVHLKQRGLMKLQPDQQLWTDAEAEQIFTVDKPGFMWRVRTTMVGVPVIGRDLFSNGKGSMEIRLAGTIPVVKVSNHKKINESTIQRYLGEIVWFPSAALSPYIQWEPVNEHSAKATMSYEGTTGSAVFHFNDQGDLEKFVAPRYKDINDEAPTDWVATVKETQSINGIRIPTRLEAAWLMKEETFTWYKFEVYDVTYNLGI